MSKERHTLAHPSQICIVVGMAVGLIGSFLIAILLGTGYGFGLVLHLVLAGLAGWMLAIRCTENGDELFGIVGFFYTPQRHERLAEAAGRLGDTAKAQVEKVAEAARRLPEQAAGTADSPRPGSHGPDGRSPDAIAPSRSPSTATAGDPLPKDDAPMEQVAPAPAGEPAEGVQPPLLDAPRGDPDDLTRISGVGAKLATMLNESGIWHFAQIATWSDDEIDWIDNHIGAFRGRARRDDWVGQARALAGGGEAPAATSPDDGSSDRG